ncbi:unnamed protein product [Diamesa serratosioi]
MENKKIKTGKSKQNVALQNTGAGDFAQTEIQLKRQSYLSPVRDVTRTDNSLERRQKSKFTVSSSPSSKVQSFSLPGTPRPKQKALSGSFDLVHSSQKLESKTQNRKEQDSGIFLKPNSYSTFKYRKSVSLLELKLSKTNARQAAENSYVKTSNELLNFKRDTMNADEDSVPKFLVYKTFYQMMRLTWRKRKEQVTMLENNLKSSKSAIMKTKNQLHVVNSLYSVERKHYEKTRDEINVLQLKFDSITKDYQTLEVQFDFLDEDHKSKTTLSNTLELLLSEEKQKNVILEEENKKLQDEVERVKDRYIKEQKQFQDKLRKLECANEDNLIKLQIKMTILKEYEEKFIENDLIFSREVTQRKEIDMLNGQLEKLTNEYESTILFKARRIYGILPKSPVFYLRIFFFCLLTGNPPVVDVKDYNDKQRKKNCSERIVGSNCD